MEGAIYACLIFGVFCLFLAIRTFLNKGKNGIGAITNIVIVNELVCGIASFVVVAIQPQAGLLVLLYAFTSGTVLGLLGRLIYIRKCSVMLNRAMCTQIEKTRLRYSSGFRPHFDFEYEGVVYEDVFDADTFLSEMRVRQGYKVGWPSTIFVNPDNPRLMVLSRAYPYVYFILLVLLIVVWVFIIDDIQIMVQGW